MMFSCIDKHGMMYSSCRMSARLSGINLTVLGLGEPYEAYDDKLKRYYSFLHETTVAKDDDLVVFIDAYDVLLFPHSRRLHELIAQSPTPIVACAESGVYPEPMVCRIISAVVNWSMCVM